jgi:ribosomal protein S12 methylthiotransferase
MLTAMHRKITSASIIKLLDKIKNGIPEIALRTSLIVGFPGETQKHFRQMADFVKQGWFDRLGVFSYSHEEGTAAYKLKDNVSKAEKQARMEQIMEIQYDISYQKNRNKVGKTYAAIIDECVEKQYICRTEYDSPEIDNTVIIQAVQALKIGHFYPVKITHAEAYDLYGEVQQPL